MSRSATVSKQNERLPIEAISRAADRTGRCGRNDQDYGATYSKDDYEARRIHDTRNKTYQSASVVLQTKVLKLGKLEEFPLLDPPRPEAIRKEPHTI